MVGFGLEFRLILLEYANGIGVFFGFEPLNQFVIDADMDADLLANGFNFADALVTDSGGVEQDLNDIFRLILEEFEGWKDTKGISVGIVTFIFSETHNKF